MLIEMSSSKTIWSCFCLLLLASTAIAQEPLVWIGAVSSTSFTIHADIPRDAISVVVSKTSDFSTILYTRDPDHVTAVAGEVLVYRRLRRFTFPDLSASTQYHVGVQRRSNTTVEPITAVRTFPDEESTADVTFALSSCHFRARWHAAFDDILLHHETHLAKSPADPFVMLHMGDIAYADISTNDASLYESSIREVVTKPAIHDVFKAMPVVYMFDDHDYGANNADSKSPSRAAAMQNYRVMVPKYPSPLLYDDLHHAFTVGRVRVIVTDLRSHSEGDKNTTMGLPQRAWFLDQLKIASSYAVVVWLSTKPWIGRAQRSKDSWAGFEAERQLIANEIATKNISNLVFIAGDAHMLAADDGSNSDYSSDDVEGGGGFPVFQAAPLANVGTSKGGPYSEGCHAYRFFLNQQYGMLRITNLGDLDSGPCVEFSGFRSGRMNKPVVRWRKCGQLSAVKGSPGQDARCSISLFPAWVWILLSIGILWITAICVSVSLLRRAYRLRLRKAQEAGSLAVS